MRSLLAVPAVALVVAVGGAAAVAVGTPTLEASGPVSVTGTTGTGVFTVGERTVRQVRYADDGELDFTFTLTNPGRVPVTVVGLAEDQTDPRLFDLVSLSSAELGPGEGRELTLTLGMNGCETLSSRAGSFVSEVTVRTERAGVLEDDVVVALPEEIHTGSPREASCPRSTATSRPRG